MEETKNRDADYAALMSLPSLRKYTSSKRNTSASADVGIGLRKQTTEAHAAA